jgi:hypothetical protein
MPFWKISPLLRIVRRDPGPLDQQGHWQSNAARLAQPLDSMRKRAGRVRMNRHARNRTLDRRRQFPVYGWTESLPEARFSSRAFCVCMALVVHSLASASGGGSTCDGLARFAVAFRTAVGRRLQRNLYNAPGG